jgi:soluble lytic murein transglycosylase-like protein
MRLSGSILVLTATVLTGGVAHAAEHVLLKNGFDLICDHREVNGDHIRLYTTGSSFVEVRADEISSVEAAPELPVQPQISVSPEHPDAIVDIPSITAKAGQKHNIDVDLLASIIRAESAGNSHAISKAGAGGLMQLMPATAQQLGVEDRFHPEQNINGGTAYLDSLLTRYHDNLPLALAAYNAGPTAVDRYHGIPPFRETRNYVARVIREFNRRVTARQNAAASTVTTASSNKPAAEQTPSATKP